MSEKKSEKDLQQSLDEVLTKEKIDELYKTIATNQSAFGVTSIWDEYTSSDWADKILDDRAKKKAAEKTLLENKKKLFEELGLEWDQDIVKWIEEGRLLFVQFYNHIPDTEVSESFRKKAELLATYINKHTKLGKLL